MALPFCHVVLFPTMMFSLFSSIVVWILSALQTQLSVLCGQLAQSHTTHAAVREDTVLNASPGKSSVFEYVVGCVCVCVSVCWCEEQSSLSCAHRLQSTVNDEDCIKTRPSVSHVRAAKTLTPCKGRKAAATMQVNQPSGFAHSKSLNFEWNEPPSTLLFFS